MLDARLFHCYYSRNSSFSSALCSSQNERQPEKNDVFIRRSFFCFLFGVFHTMESIEHFRVFGLEPDKRIFAFAGENMCNVFNWKEATKTHVNKQSSDIGMCF